MFLEEGPIDVLVPAILVFNVSFGKDMRVQVKGVGLHIMGPDTMEETNTDTKPEYIYTTVNRSLEQQTLKAVVNNTITTHHDSESN